MRRPTTVAVLAVLAALAILSAEPSALHATHPRAQCYADCRAIRDQRMRQLRQSGSSGPLSADDRRDLARLRRQTHGEYLQCRRDCRSPSPTTPECDSQCAMWTDASARLEDEVRSMGTHMSRDDRVDVANLRTSFDSGLRDCRRNCMSGSPSGEASGPASCPDGQVPANDPFRPYRCAPNGQGAGSGQGGNFGNCPAGQHAVATNDAFQPYRCVLNGQGSSSGQGGNFGNCPAGQHAVATNDAFQPYRCVPNGP